MRTQRRPASGAPARGSCARRPRSRPAPATGRRARRASPRRRPRRVAYGGSAKTRSAAQLRRAGQEPARPRRGRRSPAPARGRARCAGRRRPPAGWSPRGPPRPRRGSAPPARGRRSRRRGPPPARRRPTPRASSALNSASRTRSLVGRVVSPRGTTSRRPPSVPGDDPRHRASHRSVPRPGYCPRRLGGRVPLGGAATRYAATPRSAAVEVGLALRVQPGRPARRAGRAAFASSGSAATTTAAASCPRLADDVLVPQHPQQPQRRPAAGLRGAEHVALAPLLQVDAGQLEAVERARRPRPAAPATGRRRASVTSRHSPGAEPRPTRPRSWCSCETPNRSASSTTIAVAFGTSTPTSTTVVATRTSTSPGREPAHDVVPLVRRQPAVQRLDPQPGQRAASRAAARASRPRRAAGRRSSARPRPAAARPARPSDRRQPLGAACRLARRRRSAGRPRRPGARRPPPRAAAPRRGPATPAGPARARRASRSATGRPAAR